jgi:DNA helicase II / ATP-dependent DNA helicase PcrA
LLDVNSNTADQLPDYLLDLNPPQREAVCHFKGPILVLAGAGSGKTRVLTRRVAHLVLAQGVRPQNILAVTFTNKATDEMRERLSGLLGKRAGQLWVATFHSTALRILRRHADKLGYSKDFVVYDDQDAKSVLKDVLKECQVNEKKYPLSTFVRTIDAAKNAFVLPEEHYRWFKSEFGLHGPQAEYEAQLRAEVYDKYQRILRKSSAMDFGDLLVNVVLLFQQELEILKFYQHQLHFVLVDEFQDTNKVQYMFVRQITETRKNLLVVGDDDQSIYAFRGATVRNILEFEQDFPDTKVVMLEQNYRSTGNILAAAWGVIKRNPARRKKKLWTAGEHGHPVSVFAGSDETEEAQFVTRQIQRLTKGGKSLREVAIFYRTNAQSRAIEEALVDAGLPYRIYGGLKFYERKEIKDILAYLRLVVNPADDAAFLRTINTPPRGIGAQTVQGIANLAAAGGGSLLEAARRTAEKNKNVKQYVELLDRFSQASHTHYLSALISMVVKDSDYGPRLEVLKDVTAESRLENLRELEAIGRSMEMESESHLDTMKHFLDRVSLTASDEKPQEAVGPSRDAAHRPDAVSLMTLHLAKGLEFPVVFLTGMEEGLLPHYRSIFNEAEVEEERRLCYVGITRAMQQLFITRALSRGFFSSGGDGFAASSTYREASRFLYDIPEELVEFLSDSGS